MQASTRVDCGVEGGVEGGQDGTMPGTNSGVSERVDQLALGPEEIGKRLIADLRRRHACPGLGIEALELVQGTGNENVIAMVELRAAPERLAGPLVLRLYPPDRDPQGARFEAIVHGALAAQGYAVPRVRDVCSDPQALGGGYLLMDRIPGRLLLGEVAELDRVFSGIGSALRRAPRMLYEGAVLVPRQLARLMLALHALDADRIAAELEREGFTLRAFTAEGRLDVMEQQAAESSLDGLRDVLGWLRERYQPPRERVLCHADFHFLNVILQRGRVTGVIDWSFEHVSFGDPELDVGNTRALFDIRVPGLPTAAQPLFLLGQRRLHDGFTRAYGRGRALDRERVRWAEVYRYVREMVNAGRQIRAGAQGSSGFLQEGENPWLNPAVQAGLLEGIERRTGVPVALPEGP